LGGMAALQELDLSYCPQVGDASLAQLKGLTGLRTLYLTRTPVGDAGLKALSGLNGLQKLYLEHTGVGDAGLAHLQGVGRSPDAERGKHSGHRQGRQGPAAGPAQAEGHPLTPGRAISGGPGGKAVAARYWHRTGRAGIIGEGAVRLGPGSESRRWSLFPNPIRRSARATLPRPSN
jgi:hypothetical protein